MKKIGKLHVLTDTVLQSRFSHTELARLAIAGGADTIQYRQKIASTGEMIEIAKKMNKSLKLLLKKNKTNPNIPIASLSADETRMATVYLER